MASDQLRLKKQKLQYVLEQCQRALDQVKDDDDDVEDANEELCPNSESDGNSKEEIADSDDYESSELCDLLKSRFESPEFLEKLGSMHMSVHHCCSADDSASWDMVSANDLWEDKIMTGDNEFDQDGYVLVKQDDIVEGIATFMAAYLLSLEQAKELTPNQLQEALGKTFSVKKEKSKLQKAWDGSKVVYNVASWSATAIGIYQNPALLRAASVAFWTSCRVISKLL